MHCSRLIDPPCRSMDDMRGASGLPDAARSGIENTLSSSGLIWRFAMLRESTNGFVTNGLVM